MPVFNAQRFLAEAIESVLNQSFDDFEFLIIDDGSTDRSADIIRSFTDHRIRFIQNEKNLGIMATLNRGIEMASAELIARMDADDICLPTRFERQLAFVNQHPDGVLFSCWAEEVTEDKALFKLERYDPDHYYYNLTFSCWTYHSTLVYKREAVKSVGMYTVPYAEDFELIWQLTRRYRFYAQPEVLLKYRISGQSLSHGKKKKEYDTAFQQQLRRNIDYYHPSPERPIMDWQLQVFGSNAVPKNINLSMAVACLKTLKDVSKSIQSTSNVNLVENHVIAAARKKRQDTLLLLFAHLGAYKGSRLLLKAKAFPLLWQLLFRRLSRN